MTSKSKVYIVIAAYNEAKSISKVVLGLRKNGYNNIVIVDDGSKDNTFEVASKTGAEVLQHMLNRGQGASLQTGITFALQQGADYIVTYDADGQHHPEDIKVLLKVVMDSKTEVALGSRFLKKDSNTPLIRKLVLKIGVLVTWILYGIKLTDSHNGFRVFSRSAAKKINITSDRMEHASQIVEQIHLNNISYKEVPVTISYTDYSKGKGQSSLNSIKIGFRMLFRKFLH